MSYSSFAKSLAYKPNACKSLVIKRQLSWVKNKKLKTVPDLFLSKSYSCCHLLKFIHKRTCNQSVTFALLPRNISTTRPAWSFQGSNQDREKRNNYIFIAVVLGVVSFVIYMNLTMRYSEDQVFVKVDEGK